MSMTADDWMREQAIEDLVYREQMKEARRNQCIFLFVEGESEEKAIPILFERIGFSLEDHGVVVANYNGIGNLKHALRLLQLTLSHDRPIVVTLDNDHEGEVFFSETLPKLSIDSDLTTFFTIPSEPVVTYRSGYKGGAFEDAFEIRDFIDSAFYGANTWEEVGDLKAKFEAKIDPSKEHFNQYKQFCFENKIVDSSFSQRKAEFAIELAENCKTIPSTFIGLADHIREVRSHHPVKHPDEVTLPKIPGLTS